MSNPSVEFLLGALGAAVNQQGNRPPGRNISRFVLTFDFAPTKRELTAQDLIERARWQTCSAGSIGNAGHFIRNLET